MKPREFTETIDGWWMQVVVNVNPTYPILDTYIRSPKSQWAKHIATNKMCPNGMDAAIEAGRKAIEKWKAEGKIT